MNELSPAQNGLLRARNRGLARCMADRVEGSTKAEGRNRAERPRTVEVGQALERAASMAAATSSIEPMPSTCTSLPWFS
jgi:hypothetical protein